MTPIAFRVFFIYFHLLCLDSLCVIGGYKAATVEQLGSYPRINKNQRSGSYSNSFNSKAKSSPILEPEFDNNEEITRRNTGFIDRSSRVGFIRKVYSIFTFQTFITAAITSTILLNPNLGNLLHNNRESVVVGSLIGQIASSFSLILSEKIRFTFPINMIILTIYSISQSLIVGLIASTLETRTVCAGTIHTLITFIVMTLFAFQSNPKYDLTPFGNALLTGMTAFTVGVISAAFFGISVSSAITNGVCTRILLYELNIHS